MDKICIMGAGSWGTALAILLAKNGFEIYLWGRPEDGIEDIKHQRENRRFLPGATIPAGIIPTTDMAGAMKQARMVIIAVPSQAVRQVTVNLQPFLEPATVIVNVAKGLEINTALRMSEVVTSVLGAQIRNRYAVLSGPSHAEEVARDLPTAVTVAALHQDTACFVQDIFMSPNFRVYTNPDVVGVELGGALKNIIALGTGISYGLNYGDNTAAALLTRGLSEIVRMGVALGGDPRTFMGLSGVGDLVVTCGSNYSRNLRAGRLIGQGEPLESALSKIGMVVEGVYTTRAVHVLAVQMNIEMPITTACYNVLYRKKDPRQEVGCLMQRRKKHEIEEL